MADETTKNTTLSRDSILGAQDVRYVEVATPEWGGTTRIRTLNSYDRGQLEFWCLENQNSGKVVELYARVLIACVVGPDNKKLFSEDDLNSLLQKSGEVIHRVGTAALQLNKVGSQETEDLVKK